MRHPAYEDSQILWLAWILLPLTATTSLAARLAHATPHLAGAPLAVGLVGVVVVHLGILLVFGRFVVSVDARAVEWRFGFLGWPRWRLPLDEVASVEVTRSTWLEGWGIRSTRHGMLYNASGFGAVRLRRRDGRSVRVGSRDPARLAQFIKSRLPRG